MIDSTLKIGDLIEVPEVQTIIRLEEGRTKPQEIARSFVFTREVASHYTVIAESLINLKGQGYFLQGDFGSGKSHFCAALYTLLQDEKGAAKLAASHPGLARFRKSGFKILPVDISLIKYRAVTPFEQIIITCIEEALIAQGVKAELTPLHHFISWLKDLLGNKQLSEAFAAETGVERKTFFSWIDEHQKEAYKQGIRFIKNQGLHAPEQVVDERHETFNRALTLVKESGFDGLFLIIDELSEFFRSKPDARLLNEDARTLQFLGELSMGEPLWIIGAVQESIEKTGDISQNTFRKIKDRFPVKLILSTLHIRSLIAERLVVHKTGADDTIYQIHEEYKRQFSTFNIAFKEFCSMYPVHPVTISLLDGLGELFSVHRGIVDFVHSRLAGDPGRHIRGILERPAMEMLSPDSIYDHFESRIGEFSAFHIYPRHIIPHLEKVIEQHIHKKEEQELALRLVKILVLYTIHPAAEVPTVRELTELSGSILFLENPDMNVRFIAEAILDPIVEHSRFLVKKASPTGDPLQAVYTFETEDDPAKLLKSRIEQAGKEIEDTDSRLIFLPLSELEESLSWPGPPFLEKSMVRHITWCFSSRSILIRFLTGHDDKAAEIDRFAYELNTGGYDCGLLFVQTEKKISIDNTAVWMVAHRQKQDKHLREYLAIKLVLDSLKPSNPADAPLVRAVEERYERLGPVVHRTILDAVYEGKFITPKISVSPVIRQLRRFDKILEVAGEALLDARYPDFRRIAPRRCSPSPRLYQRLLDDFVKPGSILLREARSRGISDAIEGLAVPLGIVVVRTGSYVFSPDITEYPLLTCFFGLIKAASHIPVKEVVGALKTGGYGMTGDMISFLVVSLACAGLITLLQNGRTIPVDMLGLLSLEKADHIAPGELINKADRETLRRECTFLAPLEVWESFGLVKQREAWNAVVKFKETSNTWTTGIAGMLSRYSGYSAFTTFSPGTIEQKLGALERLSDEIKISYSAKEGLERFIGAWRGSGLSAEDIEFFKRFHRFLQNHAQRFIFIHHYMTHPEVERVCRENTEIAKLRNTVFALFQKPDIFIVSDEGKHLDNVFFHFKDHYISFYGEKHDLFYRARQKKILSKYAERALGTLSSLSRIQSLDRPAGLSTLFEKCKGGKTPSCFRKITEVLQNTPICTCGFTTDQPPEEEPYDPDETISNCLYGYIDILKNPNVLEAMMARAYALGEKDESGSKHITAFCKALGKGKVTTKALLDFLDAKTISYLDEALSGKVTIKKINANDLFASLSGRRLSAQQILDIVGSWVSGGDEHTIFAIEGRVPSQVRETRPLASWWESLHEEIFGPEISGISYEASSIAETLEQAYPSTDLKKYLIQFSTENLTDFIIHERFHYELIYAAWLILAGRIIEGVKWPELKKPDSFYIDKKKAAFITGDMILLQQLDAIRNHPFPGQLLIRLSCEKLISHPRATDRLKKDTYAMLKKCEADGDTWLATLPPVTPIGLDDAPIVLILDSIPADVWLSASETIQFLKEELPVKWYRLEAEPVTAPAISHLFGFAGDPLDEFRARGIAYHTLRGDEENTLADYIMPIEEKKPVVIRVNLFDRGTHNGLMHLSDMTDILRRLLKTQIHELSQLCITHNRRFILTVDHGISLTEKGLSHGRGGVFERTIARAESQ